MIDLDEFLRGYALTALWSSSIEEEGVALWMKLHPGDTPAPAPDCSLWSFGFEVENIAPDSMAAMREDCEGFIAGSLAALEAYCEQMGEWHGSDSVRGSDARYSAAEQAGGDFWLTRNGHGAGFRDRGNGEPFATLARDARVYGESTLYLGDEETIYVA